MSRLVLVLATVLCLAAASASAAQAEQRYAAPAGEGTMCTEAQPCLLEEAVTKAKTGDEVIVGAGSHTLSKSLQTALGVENLDIHGAAGGAMPTIVASTSSAYALDFRGAGGRLSYLAVEDTAATFAWAVKCLNGGRVERVRISATGNPSIGLLQGEDCMLRDSLIEAEGSNAQAILATGGSGDHVGIARNVTAVGTGPESTGITSSYSGGAVLGSYTLDARNVIASGAGVDLRTGGGDFGVGHFAIFNSNFETTKFLPASTISGSANQTAPPLFVDPLGGDFREAPGSPTIDAGSTDQIGSLDLDGNPRLLGAAPDIGAFELVPPPAGPPAAVAATPTAKAGDLTSLKVVPRKFRARSSGGSTGGQIGKSKPPVGARVIVSLSAPAELQFTVSRIVAGRRVGSRCVRRTAANAARGKCSIRKPIPGSFALDGVAGESSFVFSGRLAGRALRPGAYLLNGAAGNGRRSAPFTIARLR
jgi:hypothetical protein